MAPRESFARVDFGVRRRRAASIKNVGGDIAEMRTDFLAG